MFSIISTARRSDVLLLTGMMWGVDENPCGLFCEFCRIVEPESTWLTATLTYQIITIKSLGDSRSCKRAKHTEKNRFFAPGGPPCFSFSPFTFHNEVLRFPLRVPKSAIQILRSRRVRRTSPTLWSRKRDCRGEFASGTRTRAELAEFSGAQHLVFARTKQSSVIALRSCARADVVRNRNRGLIRFFARLVARTTAGRETESRDWLF